MKIDIKGIINFLLKRSFLIIIIGFLLVIVIFELTYWKYLYLPTHLLPEETIIKNKIEEDNLKFLIKNIETREENYHRSLNKEYSDPFQ